MVGRILVKLAEGDPISVSALAAALALPRSSVFACVRALEGAGLVERDGARRVSPGPEAARLGFARHGIGALQGPTAPLLTVLRSDTNASAALILLSDGQEMALVRRRASWDTGETRSVLGLRSLEAQIHRTQDGRRVVVRLRVHPSAKKTDLALAATCLDRVAHALKNALDKGNPSEFQRA
ncbi:MAG: helix-turn-helix domain-containing protein [Proteobacteria bacterium]|nr:helix-turn-helix domain-containing protein [Pseudomonadota bacterium]MBI3496712.1 helix-turn-helix domain-containing protein [Pseudomonadota bacterium]